MFVIAVVFFQQKAFAQLPEVSTASDPIWYYIQVLGIDDDREGRVFTVEGTTVSGRKIVNSTNLAEVNLQLWRFEKSGDNYIIINRATGQKADITYDATRTISHISLSDNPITEFKITELGDYYNIIITNIASGGKADEIYAHQANKGGDGKRDYVIMMVGNDYANALNSSFSFVLFEDFEIEYSTNDSEVWYNIVSAKEEYKNQSIADNTNATNPEYAFTINNTLSDARNQQWKIIKRSDNLVEFINRETNNVIVTKSEMNGAYNITQFAINTENSSGWNLTYLGSGQYSISGEEEDLVTRFLNASVADDAPDVYNAKEAKDSGFAWQFKKPETVSINNPGGSDVKIYSINGYIFVEGADDYTINNLMGTPVKPNSQVPTGVYIVTVNGATTKILVK